MTTQQIINHFGNYNQLKKASEELRELAEAIEEGDKQHITEEIADVEIMLEQLMIIKDINRVDVDNYKRYKNNRTINRIRVGYYKEGVGVYE